MQGADKNDGWRIPADQLEQAVLQELSKFLKDGAQVANAIYDSDGAPDKIQASIRIAANVSKEIRKNPTTRINTQVRQLVTQARIIARLTNNQPCQPPHPECRQGVFVKRWFGSASHSLMFSPCNVPFCKRFSRQIVSRIFFSQNVKYDWTSSGNRAVLWVCGNDFLGSLKPPATTRPDLIHI